MHSINAHLLLSSGTFSPTNRPIEISIQDLPPFQLEDNSQQHATETDENSSIFEKEDSVER